MLLTYNLYIILTEKYAPSQTAMESFITYLESDLAVLHKLILWGSEKAVLTSLYILQYCTDCKKVHKSTFFLSHAIFSLE